MFSPIGEHVHERVTHLARRSQHAGVIAVRPHRSVPAERPIDGACNANGEALYAASELRCSLRFDEEMHVVRLHAELDDAEAVVGRRRESPTHDAEHPAIAQARDGANGTQGHVHRTTRIVRCASAMHHRASTGTWLASGGRALPAPGANELNLAHHLIGAVIS